MHREHGLVLAIPRDGGKIMEIDEHREALDHFGKATRVGPPGRRRHRRRNSDTVVVADNIANVLAFTNTAGVKPKIYQRLSGTEMGRPKDVRCRRLRQVGHLRLRGAGRACFAAPGDDSTGRAPLLPNYGGVAADPTSTRWAAAQPPNQIYGYDGNELVKKLRLPPNKSLYRGGLLSLARPAVVCAPCGTATRPTATFGC